MVDGKIYRAIYTEAERRLGVRHSSVCSSVIRMRCDKKRKNQYYDETPIRPKILVQSDPLTSSKRQLRLISTRCGIAVRVSDECSIITDRKSTKSYQISLR